MPVSQDDRLQVGLHDPLDSEAFADPVQFLQLWALAAPRSGERLERDVPHALSLETMLLNAEVEHWEFPGFSGQVACAAEGDADVHEAKHRASPPATINLRLAAVRRIAYAATDTGRLSPELAAGIRRVKGAHRIGVRLGNWLTPEQGRRLLESETVDRAPVV